MKLENKSVIVTGSGRGIGEYIAKRLAREGANAGKGLKKYIWETGVEEFEEVMDVNLNPLPRLKPGDSSTLI